MTLCLAQVDRANFCVTVGAAHESGVQRADGLDVVDVGGSACNEPRVLATPNAGAEECREGHRLFSSGSADGFGCRRDAVALACTFGHAFTQRFCSGFHGADDVVIAGAAANVSADARPDFVIARIGIAPNDVDSAHDHPSRAVAALQAVLGPK